MQFHTIPEAAKMLGKSAQWTYILVLTGRIQSFKAGRNYIIPKEAIDKFLSENLNNNINNKSNGARP